MSPRKRRLPKIVRWEIRRQLLGMMCQGHQITAVVDALVKQYNRHDITTAALMKDWQRRKHWLPELTKLDNPEELVKDLLFEMAEARHRAWDIYRQALRNKNENAAVGALKHVTQTIRDQIEIMQSIGSVTQAAQKIDAFISGPGALPWESVPEVKAAMDKLKETFRTEHDAANPK